MVGRKNMLREVSVTQGQFYKISVFLYYGKKFPIYWKKQERSIYCFSVQREIFPFLRNYRSMYEHFITLSNLNMIFSLSKNINMQQQYHHQDRFIVVPPKMLLSKDTQAPLSDRPDNETLNCQFHFSLSLVIRPKWPDNEFQNCSLRYPAKRAV